MTRPLDKRGLLKAMRDVRKVVEGDIRALSQGGRYAAGLSTEGYTGGYLQALDDIDAMLRHGYPRDPNGYWLRAALKEGRDE